jgi:hypothetical protein
MPIEKVFTAIVVGLIAGLLVYAVVQPRESSPAIDSDYQQQLTWRPVPDAPGYTNCQGLYDGWQFVGVVCTERAR